MKKVILLFAFGLSLMFTILIMYQFEVYSRFDEEGTQLAETLEQEEKHQEALLREQEYYGSDAYVEKIAREKLHMVKPDEWVIINDSAK